jgi:hypothetical protein
MGVEPFHDISRVEDFEVSAFMDHENKCVKGTIKGPEQLLHNFMVSDILCTESLQFIRNVTQAIECLLAALISNPSEPIEFGTEGVNASFFLRGDTFIDFLKDVPKLLSCFTLSIAKVLSVREMTTNFIFGLHI